MVWLSSRYECDAPQQAKYEESCGPRLCDVPSEIEASSLSPYYDLYTANKLNHNSYKAFSLLTTIYANRAPQHTTISILNLIIVQQSDDVCFSIILRKCVSPFIYG